VGKTYTPHRKSRKPKNFFNEINDLNVPTRSGTADAITLAGQTRPNHSDGDLP
jgi:hypothetical protein